MAEVPAVLIVRIGSDYIDEFVATLADDPDLRLITPTPVGLAQAEPYCQRRDVAVALIIGREAEAREAGRQLRKLRRDLNIVELWIESGDTHLRLPDTNFAQLQHLIHERIRAAAKGEQAKTFCGRVPPARIRNLPVPIDRPVHPAIMASLAAGLDWVETATRHLMEIWSIKTGSASGLAISWDALERWWKAFATIVRLSSDPAEQAYRTFLEKLGLEAARYTPMVRVARALGERDTAMKLFLLALASDVDIRFHRLFGVLHDDLGRRYPSTGLACAIIAAATRDKSPVSVRAEIAGLRRLRRSGLIEGLDLGIPADAPLQCRAGLVEWLLSNDEDRLTRGAAASLMRPTPRDAIQLLPATRLRMIKARVEAVEARGADDEEETNASSVTALLLSGSAPGWIEVEAGALADAELRIGPPATPMAHEPLGEAVAACLTAARLTELRLVVELPDGEGSAALWQALRPMLGRCHLPPIIVAANPARLLGDSPAGLAVVALPQPSREDRRGAVARALAGTGIHDAELAQAIADRFPVGLRTIPDAVSLAGSAAAERGGAAAPSADDWLAGFRRAAGAHAGSLARRIEPQPCGDMPEKEGGFLCLEAVILPADQSDQLRTIIRHVRSSRLVLDEWGFGRLLDSRGVAALFAGDSGTGKTMAAQAIASELAADLYAVDLAQVVSKYIGETEKNLDLIFDDAEKAGAVVLFDEADALFGKRSAVGDAHDRYANIEVAYLLQRMQIFPGLAILTTNHPENIDSAFTRRLGFRVDFPRPSAASRRAIWEQSVPPERRAGPIDFHGLGQLDVTGGTIRQMALHAAMLVAEADGSIGLDELLAGARAVLVRLGSFTELAKLDALTRQQREAA